MSLSSAVHVAGGVAGTSLTADETHLSSLSLSTCPYKPGLDSTPVPDNFVLFGGGCSYVVFVPLVIFVLFFGSLDA